MQSLHSLCSYMKLLESEEECGAYIISPGSLDVYMKLDSKAADAINLFPKSDDPSVYGSLYGLLNRCKTKMGQRLLDRYVMKGICVCIIDIAICNDIHHVVGYVTLC